MAFLDKLKSALSGDEIDIPNLLETEESDDHVHEWQETTKTYASPRRDIQFNEGLDKDLVEKSLFGATTILWQCVICRTTRKETLIGSEVPVIEEILDKVEMYGPQYLQRNGTTFSIMRHSQVAAGTNLPLR